MSKGLAIQPASIEVTVTDEPISDVEFSQYRVNLKVQVKCIKSCDGVTVALGNVVLPVAEGADIVAFKNVLPGTHDLKVPDSVWCWKAHKQQVVISHRPDVQPESVTFEQEGFKMTCLTTHDTAVDIELNGTVVHSVDMKKTEAKFCLTKVGEYNLVPKSCHKFKNSDKLVFNTDTPKPVLLTAVAHQVRLQLVTADHEAAPSKILATVAAGQSGEEIEKEFILTEGRSQPGELMYELIHYVKGDNETLLVTPQSDQLLFEPTKAVVVTSSEKCDKILTTFRGVVGKYERGAVTPATAGVSITISSTGMKSIVVLTQEDGTYSYGPLYPTSKYVISAAYKDHSLIPVAGNPGSFLVKKLSKMIFQVKTEGTNEPLSDVIITITGGAQKQSFSKQSGENGQLIVNRLEPGTYSFKVAMKEWKFNLQTTWKVVELEQGKEMSIEVLGKRTAFSCYGNVTSLNNEPEVKVSVRAKIVASESCSGPVEGAETGVDGKYVIKGLKPGCDYTIAVHDASSKFASLVPSSVVKTISPEDITNMNFIAFRPLNDFYLSGYLSTKREFLPFIKIELYRASDPSKAVSVIKMNEESPFFHFPRIDKDNDEYIVKLESTLSTSNYEFSSQTATFFASGPHKHVSFQFFPKVKQTSMDHVQVSLTSLPFTILIMILFFNWEQVVSKSQSAMGYWRSKRAQPQTATQVKSGRKGKK